MGTKVLMRAICGKKGQKNLQMTSFGEFENGSIGFPGEFHME